ncbi:imidazolonepropionase [Gaiella sp.]|uniref:imidazolonepropionase n=1 Tax=Gaiella sp. TaxID=2663207 RepID=UPI003982D825
MTDLLIRDLAQVATPAGAAGPLRGPGLRGVVVIEDAYILCRDGRVESVGRMGELTSDLAGGIQEIDGRGLCAIPGLVDCHTHACFAGDRVNEFSLRAGGASYEELHAAGGGILSTVRATRAAEEEELTRITVRHRGWMRAHGTTTFEGKSGYGLDRDTELSQLRAVRAAGGVPTWLGAHTVPPEFDGADAYVDFLLAEVLPQAATIAEAADVFLERGSFDAAQSRRYLRACAEAGLALRLHGDQFTESGAIELAVELEARSVDHLEATGLEGVAILAASDVTGVLLPASALFLGRPMPPARALADAGGLIALATDFNPGSAFCDSLPFVLSLACTQLHLAPEEALVAATANAAHVLDRSGSIGRLRAGFAADIVLLEAPDWRHVAYHLAGDVVHTVIEGGAVVFRRTAYSV